MAFLDDVADLQAETYDAFGLPATWTPAGAFPVPCTLLPALTGEAIGGFSAGAHRNVERRRFRVRLAELVAAAPEYQPAKGDAVTLDPEGAAEALVITQAPRREDPRRTEWTWELG